MFKCELTYTDFNGIEHENQPFYFNMTKAEITKYTLIAAKDPIKLIQDVIGAEDMLTVYNTFETLVKMSYGVRTADGGFKKSEELSEDFVHTEAFAALLEKLVSEADFAAQFVNGICSSAAMDPDKKKVYDEAMSHLKQVK